MDKLELCASCSYCIHDVACAEIEGRQDGKRWGAECDYPDSNPKFEPISPEACPESGWGCDECDSYQDCYPDWRDFE